MKDGHVDIAILSVLAENLLEVGPFRIEIDAGAGNMLVIDSEKAAAPDGLLPILLIGADAMWANMTGRGLGIELQQDEKAVLRYRLQAVHQGPLSAALVGLTLFLQRAAVDGLIRSDRLVSVWENLPRRGARRG